MPSNIVSVLFLENMVVVDITLETGAVSIGLTCNLSCDTWFESTNFRF